MTILKTQLQRKHWKKVQQTPKTSLNSAKVNQSHRAIRALMWDELHINWICKAGIEGGQSFFLCVSILNFQYFPMYLKAFQCIQHKGMWERKNIKRTNLEGHIESLTRDAEQKFYAPFEAIICFSGDTHSAPARTLKFLAVLPLSTL